MTLVHGLMYYLKEGNGLAVGPNGGVYVLLRVRTEGGQLRHTLVAEIKSDYQTKLVMDFLESVLGPAQTANGIH